MPFAGTWHAILNTDVGLYSGSDARVVDLQAQEASAHGKSFCVNAYLPPLSTITLLHRRDAR
ncbi:alpha amylase C-terminal domain-containing protein [Agrobacterium cavarae]|uniref:alpha amylase C-terminal domain-containing protein n=1 Tax=Agrobacterium cavarae TaxID=2528239 RepID=UPI0013AFD5AC